MPPSSGPGPVERDRGDDVLEAVGLELLQHLAEAARFELEHAGRVAARDHLVDVGVVDAGSCRCRAASPGGALLVDQLHRGLDHGQRLEAEEVELDQAGLLDLLHRELGDDLVVLAAEARHVLPQRLLGDHDAGGVHAGVAVEPLERRGEVEQLAVQRALVVELLELGRLLDRLAHRRRLALRPARARAWRACRPRRTGSPSRARCRGCTPRALSWWNVAIWPTLVLAVLLLDVLDDLVAPVHAEVDVEVGHRHALGVQEALEQQLELDADRCR